VCAGISSELRATSDFLKGRSNTLDMSDMWVAEGEYVEIKFVAGNPHEMGSIFRKSSDA